MTSGETKITLYKQAKEGLKSLFVQTAQVSTGLIVMLIITGGNPPGWLVSTSFLFGVGFVAWSENKRQINFFKHKTPSIPAGGDASHTVSPSTITMNGDRNIQIEMNAQHLQILRQGVEAWNQWRKKNPLILPNLESANLESTNLYGANLYYANLYYASLSSADLEGADLKSADLEGADLKSTDLKSADLEGADLKSANLYNADLSNANLYNADLSNANLKRVKALATIFEGATLTGACIEDWNINSQTNLKNVKCDYIYLKRIYSEEEKKDIFCDRRPHDPNKIFAPGEFTKRYQKILETVELYFDDGIDWQAFLVSFNKLQIECGSDELWINSFEKKGNDAFVIRVNVPDGADKAEIEKYLKQQYQLEATVEAQQRELTNLYEVTKLLAGRIINVSSQSSGNTYHQSGNIGIGHNEDKIKGNAKVAGVINEAAQQDLKQAAAEIQQLLEQLSKTNPTETLSQKAVVAEKTIENIENNPTLKQKIIKAIKAMGIEAFMEAIDHPIANVLRAGIEAYREPN